MSLALGPLKQLPADNQRGHRSGRSVLIRNGTARLLVTIAAAIDLVVAVLASASGEPAGLSGRALPPRRRRRGALGPQ